jgi:hypothetical protein
MIIQMIKQLNPEHPFYVPYLQPIKTTVEQKIKTGEIEKVELENFVLPKEAAIYIDQNGIESIYVAGRPVSVFTEIPSGIVYLINDEINLIMEKHIVNKNSGIISFPSVTNKAV